MSISTQLTNVFWVPSAFDRDVSATYVGYGAGQQRVCLHVSTCLPNGKNTTIYLI